MLTQSVAIPVAVGVYELGVGRTVPSVAAVLGLLGVVVGALALARRVARAGSIVALGLGVLAAVVGGLHAANAEGGLGTGNGLAGAVVAVALGLVAAALGVLALARTRTSA
ncbi:hypothetical protein GCM10023200_39230 [Actinomycetospora chlora]|uniref:Uncharacterized protein n=1 Tax=Actinomycetospora chlora TaxID=663608 RepID=A0ABP9BQH3_9PSEU